MKRLFKKILFILIFVMLGALMSLIYQYIQYNNQQTDELKEEVQAQTNINLEKEILNKEIEKAQDFVDSINNNVALTLLRTSGKITLSHDKTPQNNAWTEWLFNSDIKIYANYTTAFTIECENITTKIDEDATVLIYYNIEDIKLSFIDITDLYSSENKSIFGSTYTPDQTLALEQIARDRIFQNSNNEKNILQAKINLENFLNTCSKNFDVNIQIQSY